MAVYNIEREEIYNAWDLEGVKKENVYSVNGTRIGFDVGSQFLDTAVLTALPSSVNVSGNKQGACTDGEYIYQAAGDATNYTYMDIIKYKIADGTYTTKRFNRSPNFGHANDAAYNPNDGCIYICTMLADGSIIVIDASTLNYVKTVYAKNANNSAYAVWQICFDRLSNRFYSASGNDMAIYDQNWNYLSTIQTPPHPAATGQGCETDGTYIYRVTYNPNLIDVMTVNGAYVTTITNPMTEEPETLMYDWSSNYYINKNITNGRMFCRATLFRS